MHTSCTHARVRGMQDADEDNRMNTCHTCITV